MMHSSHFADRGSFGSETTTSLSVGMPWALKKKKNKPSLSTYGKEVGVEQEWRWWDLLSAAHSSPGGLSSKTRGDRSGRYSGGKLTAVGSRCFILVGVDTWLYFVVPLFPANGARRHVLWNSTRSLKTVVYSKKFFNLYVCIWYILCMCMGLQACHSTFVEIKV